MIYFCKYLYTVYIVYKIMDNIDNTEVINVSEKPIVDKGQAFANIYYIYELELFKEKPSQIDTEAEFDNESEAENNFELIENPNFKINYLVFEIDDEIRYTFEINGHITSVGSIGNYDNIDCTPEILADIKELYNNNKFDYGDKTEKYTSIPEFEKHKDSEGNDSEKYIYGKLFIKSDGKYLDDIEFAYLKKDNSSSVMYSTQLFDNIIDYLEKDKAEAEAKAEAKAEAEAASKSWFTFGGGLRDKKLINNKRKTKKQKK